jgi:L-arabinokinase
MAPKRKALVYYVSAHGYGHGVRTCDVLSVFCAKYPEVDLTLVSGLPEAFLRFRLGSVRFAFRSASFDVGMVQHDSVRVDMPGTLAAVQRVKAKHDEWVRQEADFLREARADLVVADIPSVPIAAAGLAGVPCIAVGNFAWNWIYAPFAQEDARWVELIEMFEADYRQADLLLRLPFAEPMRVFARQENMPLVAMPGKACRAELSRATGAAPDKTWVLLSFIELGWDKAALDRVARLKEYEVFSVLPLSWPGSCVHAVDRYDFRFSDILASVDAVISKPGFGLVSECIVNRKPLLYTERTHFVEYPILVEGIERHLQHAHIPQRELYAGRLEDGLRRLRAAPPPAQTLANNGAELIARRFMQVMGAG